MLSTASETDKPGSGDETAFSSSDEAADRPRKRRPTPHDVMVARWENRDMPGKRKRARKADDPLAAYRSIRKPMPPPEKVVPDKRKKIEEDEVERELRERS
jgi:hypothetical protein